MYNATINYFRKCKVYNIKPLTNIKTLKSHLSSIRNHICNTIKIKILIKSFSKYVKMNKHVLDYAIQDALNNYTSRLTMYKKGYIKKFRLRELKKKEY